MITPIYYNKLGKANFGWLRARHHFSFGNYHNPQRQNFGKLRVINDDIIAAGTGFDLHPHRDMEIITYVRSGAITHKDNQGNQGRTEAGDVQVMSAGRGIYHSEHNHEEVETTLYQIWIDPNRKNVTPRWDCHAFPQTQTNEGLELLVSGDDDAPLMIHADAKLYAGKLAAGQVITQSLKNLGYLLVSKGQVKLEKTTLSKGDAAEISNQHTVTIKAIGNAEILLIDVAK